MRGRGVRGRGARGERAKGRRGEGVPIAPIAIGGREKGRRGDQDRDWEVNETKYSRVFGDSGVFKKVCHL